MHDLLTRLADEWKQNADSFGLRQDDWAQAMKMAYANVSVELLAALAQHPDDGPPVDGWLPIESAPKSSKHIILFGNGSAITQCVMVGNWRDDAWKLAFGGDEIRPTHWQPLPTPPTARPEVEAASTPIGHVTYQTALRLIAHAYRLGVDGVGYTEAADALYDACAMEEIYRANHSFYPEHHGVAAAYDHTKPPPPVAPDHHGKASVRNAGDVGASPTGRQIDSAFAVLDVAAEKYRRLYVLRNLSAEQAKAKGDADKPDQPLVAYETAQEVFAEYFAKNYPGPNTIICDPHWHAPKLFRAAYRAFIGAADAELSLRNATEPKPAGGEAVYQIEPETDRWADTDLRGYNEVSPKYRRILYAQPQAVTVDEAMVRRSWMAGHRAYTELTNTVEYDPDEDDLLSMRAALLAALAPGGEGTK